MAQRPTAFYRLVAGKYFPRPPTPALVEREVVEYCGAFTNVCWRSGNTRTRDRSLAEPHQMDRAARIVAGEGKDMTQEDILRMAREAGGYTSPRYPDNLLMDVYDLERFTIFVAAAQREKVAAWMRSMGYATGHGDTIEDLLDHLGTQIAEGLEAEVLMEREACAKVCEAKSEALEMAAFAIQFPIRQSGIVARRCADAIRARGNP